MKRCHCPDDCACRKPWRRTICGCHEHNEDKQRAEVAEVAMKRTALGLGR